MMLSQVDPIALSITGWWEIAQLAGAGAAFVLGFVAWKLWGKTEEDAKYIRQQDKETLVVLQKLTQVLKEGRVGSTANHEAVLNAIAEVVNKIKTHILELKVNGKENN